MENIEQSQPQISKRTRVSQACQPCRSLKARCIPSVQQGTCQKCYTSKRTCVWSEHKPRAKRMRTVGASRISQMERRLDGLVALLNEPEPLREMEPRSVSTSSGPGITPLHQSPMRIDSRPLPMDSTLHEVDQEPQDYPGTQNHALEPAIDHEIVRGLLSSGRANGLLEEFRSMANFFPFVPISTSMTAETLNSQKPMLLLAILATAAWRDRSLQIALDEQYRLELAHRTIVRPRKNLGVIQSVLVYLAWYHFYFTPQSQQLLSLLQLAIGLAIDLGICQKPKKALIDISGLSKNAPTSDSVEREAQRTLLGCHYLSSAFADALPNPNLLKHTDYMAECCKRLNNDLEYPSDAILTKMTTLRHVEDQINEAFLSEDSTEIGEFDMRFQMHVRLLESQMKALENYTIDGLEHRGYDLQFNFADMVLHNAATRLHSNTQTTSNTIQIDILLSCLESGKAFLDNILAIPASEYHLVSFVEWMRLPYVLVIISRLSLPSANPIPSWDIKAAQERVRIDLYLESLCYRMQSLTTYDCTSQPLPDFWLSMALIMEKTRRWYVQKMRSSPEVTGVNEESPLETVVDPHVHRSKGTERSMPSEIPPTNIVDTTPHLSIDQGGPYDSLAMDDPFAAMPDFDNLEGFLDGGLWGTGNFYPPIFGEGDIAF